MKIVSFNIGLKINNSRPVAKLLRQLDADFICLQEAARHFEKTTFPKYRSKADIDKILANRYPYRFFGPQWISKKILAQGKLHRDYGGLIEQGNYILSKYPIASARIEHYFKHYSLEIDHTNFAKIDHPRSVAIAEIKCGQKSFTLVNIHGTYSTNKIDTPRSLKQSQYLVNLKKQIKGPLMLAGDFNVTPETKSIKMLNQHYRNMTKKFGIITTLPGRKIMAIDNFFINHKIKPLALQTYQTTISDHLPLVFEFNLN
ncbi:MAG: endonuclease/exonuclease/phosphatase family protein [Candidatus Kerfeldbacteria bacterium]|nr:endonuclease/exonuclease/phosphatase family protein [Candidatus Kerfeldbacteria bacterium]